MIPGAKAYFIQNFRRTEFVLPTFVGEPFSARELQEFLQAAKPFVQHCEVRT